MSKAPTDIRSLARQHTATAISTLVGIMRSKKAPAVSRALASNSLLDRGWGKPTQYTEIAGKDGEAIKLQDISDPTVLKDVGRRLAFLLTSASRAST